MSFFLEWRDFTGGHYVGPNGTDQPRDTWRGQQVVTSASDGMLMPAAEVEEMAPSGVIGMRIDRQNYQQFGAPVVGSGYFNGINEIKQIVMWATIGYSTFDMKIRATDGLTVIGATNAGVSGDFRYPSGRGVVQITTGQSYPMISYYFPIVRDVAGVLTYFIGDYRPFANTLAQTSIPARLHIMDRWKEWLVAAEYLTNKLWFSDPLAPTTWGAGNFIEIGDPSPITAIVPMANQLYIGKQQGWFIVTGELGFDTQTVRAIDSRIGPLSFGVADTGRGIMFSRPEMGVTMHAQRGLLGDVLNYEKPVDRTVVYHNPVDVSSGVIIAGGGPQGFFVQSTLWSAAQRFAWVWVRGAWHKITLPASQTLFFDDTYVTMYMWAKDYTHTKGAAEEYAWVLTQDGTDGSSEDDPAKLYRYQLNLSDPQNGTEGTVELAEARRSPAAPGGSSLFTVKNVWLDVEIPPDPFTTTGAVGADVSLRMVGGLSSDFAAATFVCNPVSKPVSQFNGDRTLVRWEYGAQTEDGTGVIPIINLRGVKLRRVYMACEETGKI